MNFKAPFICFYVYVFVFIALCIEVEVICEFFKNPQSQSNLITWSLVWCMTSSASRASAWFHWSNLRMSLMPMFTKDVRTNQGKLGILWHMKVFLTICTRFASFLVFQIQCVRFFGWDMWFTKITSCWCNMSFWLQRTWSWSFYYEEISNEKLRSPSKLHALMDKAMD